MTLIVAAVATSDARGKPYASVQAVLAKSAWRSLDGSALVRCESATLGSGFFCTTGDTRPECGLVSLDHLYLAGDIRLDERESLERELASTGTNVSRGSSDAMIVLQAWKRWGPTSLRRIAGDYAFALWDERQKKLIAAHDCCSVVPLYFGFACGAFVVTNSLSAILGVNGIDRAISDEAVLDHLLFGLKLDPRGTFFHGVRRLKSAEYMEFFDGELRVHQYETPLKGSSEFQKLKEADYVEVFKDLFRQSVDDRLRGCSASTHLTGGMDSSSVAAVLARLAGDEAGLRLRALTLDFGQQRPQTEVQLARMTAEHLGIPLSLFTVDSASILSPFSEAHVPPEPHRAVSYPASHSMLAAAARFGRILFAGFGGEPLFTPVRQHRPATSRPVEASPPWIAPKFASYVQDRMSEMKAQRTGWESLSSMADGPMWSVLFERDSPDFTGHAVRVRYPFFDRRLIQFIASIPPLPWREGKLLLRQAMKGELPEQVRRHPKQHANLAPGLAALQDLGPQPWMDELLANDALDRWVDIACARNSLHDSSRWNRLTHTRLSFVWSLSNWLLSYNTH